MLVALANIVRRSLRKGAQALSSAAWQEIRVRSEVVSFLISRVVLVAGKL
jgi:hypothetical protein